MNSRVTLGEHTGWRTYDHPVNRSAPPVARPRYSVVVVLTLLLITTAACGRVRDRRDAANPARTATTDAGRPAETTIGSTRDPDESSDDDDSGADVGAGVTVQPAAAAVGTRSDHSLQTPDGRTRTYQLYVPSHMAAGTVPLLVALHGGLGSGDQFRTNSGFDELAESNGFIVAFPDGTSLNRVLKDNRVWNAGGCCGVAAEDRDDVDDVTFLAAVVDDIANELPVDHNRVFFAGHSNGAMMSYRMACERPDLVAGIGVQAGALMVSPCDPDHPVSVLHIHGAADANVPVEGGAGDSSISKVSYPDPHEATAAFVAADRCDPDPVDTTDPINTVVVSRTWSGCAGGTTVRFVTVTGANHAWMGHPSTSRLSNRRVGEPYADYDSSLAIWTFLASLPPRTFS